MKMRDICCWQIKIKGRQFSNIQMFAFLKQLYG